jgi:hypothetical protein
MNLKCRLMGVLVLPDAQGYPSCFGEPPVRVAITLFILSHFVRPKPGVGRGDSVVFRAPVPETTVKENSNPRFPEDEIGGPSQTLERGCRDPIAQTESMNR